MEMVRRHPASETGLLFCVKGPSSKQEKGKLVFFYCREGGGKDEKGKRIFLILCSRLVWEYLAYNLVDRFMNDTKKM